MNLVKYTKLNVGLGGWRLETRNVECICNSCNPLASQRHIAQWAKSGVFVQWVYYQIFLKFLKNIFMLTKIFEETLPWLVKILKTDQQ